MRDPSDSTGDWHSGHLLPENLWYAGEGCEVNTLPWLGTKGILTYPDLDSLLKWCRSRGYWQDLPPPYITANHKRAAVDLLYLDFILYKTKGLAVDLYSWMDRDEDIQEIMDEFQIIIDALSDTPQRVSPKEWSDYKKLIWKYAA